MLPLGGTDLSYGMSAPEHRDAPVMFPQVVACLGCSLNRVSMRTAKSLHIEVVLFERITTILDIDVRVVISAIPIQSHFLLFLLLVNYLCFARSR